MTWKALLEGDLADLVVLARTVPAGDPRVAKDESRDAYYIESASIGDATGQPDSERAEALLHRVTGIARTLHGALRPVRLSRTFVSPSGGTYVAIRPGALAIQVRAFGSVTVAGAQSESETEGQKLARVAASEPALALALRIMGQADALDWYDLYKAYEVVREAVGGDAGIVARQWATRADLKRFSMSANHPSISGDAARHAHMKRSPDLRNAMTIAEGIALVRGLVQQWVKSLPGY